MSKKGINRKEKYYARRVKRVGSVQTTIWLHKEIAARAYGIPKSRKKTIVDHKDGNSLNCRRNNLRWVTPSQNAKNRVRY